MPFICKCQKIYNDKILASFQKMKINVNVYVTEIQILDVLN